MQPIWYLIGASAASAAAAFGSCWVAILGDRERRERRARANPRATIQPVAPKARDRFFVELHNEGEGTAYDLSAVAEIAGAEKNPGNSNDVSFGDSPVDLAPGSSVPGRVEFGPVAHLLVLRLEWKESCRYLLGHVAEWKRHRTITVATNIRQ